MSHCVLEFLPQPIIDIFSSKEQTEFLQGVHARVLGNLSEYLKAWFELCETNEGVRALQREVIIRTKKNFEFYLRLPLR